MDEPLIARSATILRSNLAERTSEVIRIGTEVRQPVVIPGDPVMYNQARVVPVRIRVPACAAGTQCPINGRVRVATETGR
jgi:hypothetical protein